MSALRDIKAKEIRDTRGRATIAVTVFTDSQQGSFAVPSGESRGMHEAVELRDADGSMQSAINMVHSVIAPKLLGFDPFDQAGLDARLRELDGTHEKSHLGANAMIGVSIANARVAAAESGKPVYEYLRTLADIPASRPQPYCYANFINGGKHAQSPLAFQEYHVVPEADTVSEAVHMIEGISPILGEAIQRRYGGDLSFGDEGGYAIPETDVRVPFELLTEAVEKAGFSGKVHFAIDAAASSFWNEGYQVGGEIITSESLQAIYIDLVRAFPILSIEDPLEERALEETALLQKALPEVRIVGDDLTVTEKNHIERAAEIGAIRGVIIKPNQVGTLSETLDAMKAARSKSVDCIVSHRSGETSDTFIADLAFAFGAFGLKAGTLHQGERRAKYERLIEMTR